MTDEEHKRAQREPLSGEGPEHWRGKKRIRDIMRDHRYYTEFERRWRVTVTGLEEQIELRSDVYAVSKQRTLCIEIDGPAGHKTSRAYGRDLLKQRRITEASPTNNIDFYAFHYKRLVGRKAWTDQELKEEMRL